ncbi:MAG: TaqI-like C-terminal specificity domain-containing protein, partial [Methanosarcinales archaeon]
KKRILQNLKKDGASIIPLGDLREEEKQQHPDDFIDNKDKELKGCCKVGQGVVPGRKDVFKISKNKDEKDAGGYIIEITEKYLIVVNKKNDEKYFLEKALMRKLAINSDIEKYYLKNSKSYLIYTIPCQIGHEKIEYYSGIKNYLEVYKNELTERYDYNEDKYPWFGYQRVQNLELFENVDKKILCPYRAIENSFALDEMEYFGTTDIYAIIPKKESGLDIKYLLGILNSKLLNFWYKEAGKSKGGMFEYFTTPLSRMPVRNATPDQQKPIIELVDKIINLKKSRHKLLDLWKEWSKKLKNKEYTLHKILEEDANNLRNGNFDKTWTLNATFYPNSDNAILNQEFKKFKVIGDKEKPIIRIYGLDELNKEELIYEIKFYKREIMQHIYFSIIALLGSRKKVKSLKALFAKTVIPIIQPDAIINTANLIKKVEYELQDLDIVKIDNEIEDIEAQIDALVFKLYGLEEVDVQTVMDSLNVQGLYMHKVLEYFNNR